MNVEKFLERKNNLQREIPKNYSPGLHIGFNLGLLIGICSYSLWQLQKVEFYEIFIIPLTLVCGNFVVYMVHRYPLHHRYRIWSYPYKAHTIQHHNYFTHLDNTFRDKREFYYIFFPPFAVLGFVLVYSLVAYFLFSWLGNSNIAFLFIFTSGLYFLLYEILHYIEHLPRTSLLLKINFLRYMEEHHRKHHDSRYMHRYNFNIVFPLCDWLFGTLHREDKDIG